MDDRVSHLTVQPGLELLHQLHDLLAVLLPAALPAPVVALRGGGGGEQGGGVAGRADQGARLGAQLSRVLAPLAPALAQHSPYQ